MLYIVIIGVVLGFKTTSKESAVEPNIWNFSFNDLGLGVGMWLVFFIRDLLVAIFFCFVSLFHDKISPIINIKFAHYKFIVIISVAHSIVSLTIQFKKLK